MMVIPKSVTFLGARAFYLCKNLSSVIFEEESHVGNLESYTFRECTSLTDLKVPESVKYILSDCFKDSALENLSLPKHLEDDYYNENDWGIPGHCNVTFYESSEA